MKTLKFTENRLMIDLINLLMREIGQREGACRGIGSAALTTWQRMSRCEMGSTAAVCGLCPFAGQRKKYFFNIGSLEHY